MGNINFLSVAFAIFFFWMAWHVRNKRATNPSGMPRLQVFKRKWGESLGIASTGAFTSPCPSCWPS
jgi:hypothetical protein